MKRTKMKIWSVLLACLMVLTTLTPGLLASAASAEIIIMLDGVEVTERLSVQEYRSVQLGYTTTGDVPEGAYVTWESNLPLLAGVDDSGKVTGYDYSKEAIIQQWLDQNIRSMPLIGDALADSIESQIQSTCEQMGVDLADLDVAILISIIRMTAGDAMADSLQSALDNMNVEITATLHAADGTVLATDKVEMVVTKSVLADLYPTAVHITNKNSVPTTVAVGASVQLYGICSPVRLNEDVKWTMGGTIFDTASGRRANVTSDGLVTFTAAGSVTVRVNPQNVLYSAVTDTITFNVVEQAELPVTNFDVAGTLTIDEGATTQLAIDKLEPAGAYTGDLVWVSSDPTVAAVDQNGVVTGLDGGSGALTYSRTTTITATIGEVSKSVTVTVRRALINATISGVEIVGETTIPNNSPATYVANVTPDRLNTSSSVQRTWGITEPLTGEILWASADAPADASIAVMQADGVLIPKQSGILVIHARATQGETVLETSLTVNAGNPITDFTISGDFDIFEGTNETMSITGIAPADYDPALLQTVVWSSSNPSIATIDENGMVRGVDSGGLTIFHTRTVTITASVSGITKSVTITIRGNSINTLTGANISGSDVVLKDFPRTYSASFSPARINTKDVHWGVNTDAGERPWTPNWSSTSGNQQNIVATVDNNGVVSGVSAGQTTLWLFGREGLTSVDGSYVEASKEIEVVELEPDSITLTAPTRKTYVEGETVLDLTGLKVELNYSRAAVSEYYDTTGWADADFTVEVSDYTVSEINQNTLDREQYILVTVTRAGEAYRGVFPITLESKKVTGIQLTAPRYAYAEGETELDLTGLEVTADYNNAPSEIVTEYQVDTDAFDPTLLDVEQNIPVTYTHAGLSATATFPVIVYGTPVLSIDAGDYTENTWAPGDVTLTLSATHPMEGLTYYYRAGSDTEWLPLDGNTFTIRENGSYVYAFKAVNSVEVESAPVEGYRIHRDDVTPSFDWTPSETALTNQSFVVTVENLVVGLSGIRSVTFNGQDVTNDFASFPIAENGNYTLVVTTNNGLTCTKTLEVGYIDKEAPAITGLTLAQKNSGGFARLLNELSFGLFFKEQIELTATAEDTGVAGLSRIEYRFYNADTETYSAWATYDAQNKPVQDPNFRGYAEVRAVDNATNVSPIVTSDGYVIDGTKPISVEITATYNGAPYSSSAWVADDVELTLSSTAFSGIYGYSYRVDGGEWQPLTGNTLTATEEGRHIYEFKAESNAGLESDMTVMIVKIDRQKPVIRVAFDGTFGRWTADGARFNFSTEEESLSGITYFYSDGTGWYEFDGSELVLNQNTNASYSFKAVSGAGIESTTSDSYRVMIDTVTPHIVLTPTVTGPTCTAYDINIETFAGEAGIASVYLESRNITNRSSVSISRNGNYLFTITGVNGKTETVLLTIDNFYTPVLEIADIEITQSVSGGIAAQDGTTFGTYYKEIPEISISVNNTGTSEIQTIYYRLINNTTNTSSGWLVYDEADKPLLPEGFCGYVEARVVDTAGKGSTAYRSQGITVDTMAPTAPRVLATSGGSAYTEGAWAKGAVTLTLSSTAFSGVNSYLYAVDGGEWQTLTGNTLTTSEAGEHVYTFKAISNATLESAEASFTVRIDSETPILQIGVLGTLGTKTDKAITFTLYTPNCLSDVTYFYSTGEDFIALPGNTLTISENVRAEYRFKAVNAAGKESYVSLPYSVYFEKAEITQIIPKADGSNVITVDRTDESGSVLVGLNPTDTTVEALKTNLENDRTQIIVRRGETVLSDTDAIGTGCVVQCVSTQDPSIIYESVTVVLYGDINGDGAIDETDYQSLISASFDASAIGAGVYTTAGDLNNDGVLDAFDYALLDLQLSGAKPLNQVKPC